MCNQLPRDHKIVRGYTKLVLKLADSLIAERARLDAAPISKDLYQSIHREIKDALWCAARLEGKV